MPEGYVCAWPPHLKVEEDTGWKREKIGRCLNRYTRRVTFSRGEGVFISIGEAEDRQIREELIRSSPSGYATFAWLLPCQVQAMTEIDSSD